MKRLKKIIRSGTFFPFVLICGLFVYYLYHFNYIVMPTEDYIGNFRPFVLKLMSGNFSDISNKLLPAYPFLLACAAHFAQSGDRIYSAALVINFALLVPFLCLVYLIFVRFLGKNLSFFALLFLGLNIYTLYSGLNAELEIFLCMLSVLSLYLMDKHSKAALVPSAITAIIKWDCVFIIPAYAARVFMKTKKKRYFILFGAAASIPLLSWLAFTFLRKGGAANVYIGEIAHRGPNIYKYPIDALLAAPGFPRWLALDLYHGRDMLSSIVLGAALLAAIVLSAGLVIAGIKVFVKAKEKLEIAIFAGGFFIIHMVYQNTKDRYVIPIIWLLTMFIFLAVSKIPERLKEKFAAGKSLRRDVLYFAAALIFYIQSLVVLFEKHDIFLVSAAFFFQGLILLFLRINTPMDIKKCLLVCAAAGILCNLNIAYGRDALNHFSLRRIEFRDAALWFKENAPAGSRLLISETAVAAYYIGNDDGLIPTSSLKSETLSELEREIFEKKITHVFIDDFYITRLLIGDPNAYGRKAQLIKELRGAAESLKYMRLVKTFTAYTGGTAYMYVVNMP